LSTNLQICLRPSPPTLPRDPAAACYTSDKHDIIHILIQYTSCNISIAFGMALSERFGDMGIPPANFLCNYTQMSAALETLQSSTRAERYDSGAIL